jgi:hypothetical protein
MTPAEEQRASCADKVTELSKKVTSVGAKHSGDCERKAKELYEKYNNNATDTPLANSADKECHSIYCTAVIALIIEANTNASDDAAKQCYTNLSNAVQTHCLCRPKLNDIMSITQEVAKQLQNDSACLAKATGWYLEHEGQFETMMNALPAPPLPVGATDASPLPPSKCHKPWCDAAKLFLDTKKTVPADATCAKSVQKALIVECDLPDSK